MPTVPANGIEIACESHGPRTAPTVLLLPGAGHQLIEWPPGFVDAITGAGYHVVTMDLRDAGLSTHLTEAGKVDLGRVREGSLSHADLPYALSDMACDIASAMTALDIGSAHLVGFSLGAAVAQQIAVSSPDRVLTLSTVMASTGHPEVGRSTAAGHRALTRAPGTSPRAAVDAMVERRRMEAPAHLPFDEEAARTLARDAVERSFDPAGTGRQLAALWAAGDRSSDLAAITAPTLVIHGTEDRIVDFSGGAATAAAIPGARLLLVAGMGHDLATEFVPEVSDAILAHIRRGGNRR